MPETSIRKGKWRQLRDAFGMELGRAVAAFRAALAFLREAGAKRRCPT